MCHFQFLIKITETARTPLPPQQLYLNKLNHSHVNALSLQNMHVDLPTFYYMLNNQNTDIGFTN